MASPPSRRSGRQRKPNTKYAKDLLEEDTRRILALESEDEQDVVGEEQALAPTDAAAAEEHAPVQVDDSDPDFDFDTAAAEEAVAQGDVDGDEDDDASFADAGSVHGASDSNSDSNVVTPDEDDDEGVSIAESVDLGDVRGGEGVKSAAKKKRQVLSTGAHGSSCDSQLRSRGLSTGLRKLSKESAWFTMFGVHDEDLVPALLARDTWLEPEDAALPSRRTLEKLVGEGVYGQNVRYGIEEERLRREATRGWDWYMEERGQRFRKRQRVESVEDVETRRRHFPVDEARKHKVVLGPQKEQKMYELGEGEVMDLGEAWSEPAMEDGSSGVNTQPHGEQSVMQRLGWLFARRAPDMQPNGTKSTRKRYREGWLFNLGHRAQSMSWAPNREESQRHYLAIACPTTPEQRNAVLEPDDKRNPAFRPSGEYPSCIQIWEFACSKTSGLSNPRLL
ncbi:MAG: hypothetical protein Q9160_005291 [Pyrenula sp. 1 TL-2023]